MRDRAFSAWLHREKDPQEGSPLAPQAVYLRAILWRLPPSPLIHEQSSNPALIVINVLVERLACAAILASMLARFGTAARPGYVACRLHVDRHCGCQKDAYRLPIPRCGRGKSLRAVGAVDVPRMGDSCTRALTTDMATGTAMRRCGSLLPKVVTAKTSGPKSKLSLISL